MKLEIVIRREGDKITQTPTCAFANLHDGRGWVGRDGRKWKENIEKEYNIVSGGICDEVCLSQIDSVFKARKNMYRLFFSFSFSSDAYQPGLNAYEASRKFQTQIKYDITISVIHNRRAVVESLQYLFGSAINERGKREEMQK